MAAQLLERHARGVSHRERSLLLVVLRNFDYVLLGAVLALTALGLVTVYSATRGAADPTTFLKHQLLYAALGLFVMLVTAAVSYRRFEELGWLWYGLALLALLAVRAVGKPATETYGAQREITVGPIAIQPSEFAVITLVVLIAALVHRHENDLSGTWFLKLLVVAAVPMVLILAQPDLGTTIITFVALLCLLFMAGFRARYLAILLTVTVGGFFLSQTFHLFHGYQLERLTSFAHQPSPLACLQAPTAIEQQCYQLAQAKIAIGAGGLHGTGLFNGLETNTGFVPEAYADFIFAAIGEQLGFIGAGFVIALYLLVAFRLVRAMQIARDSFGRLVCGGTLAFLCFSAFQSIGMTIGLMPITGIPLPFISYGGSALIASYAAIGLVLNVELRRGWLR